MRGLVLWTAAHLLAQPLALAQDTPPSATPYIDQIQQELREEGRTLGRDEAPGATPFIDAQRKKIQEHVDAGDPLLSEDSAGYTEKLLRELDAQVPADGYTDSERKKLLANDQPGDLRPRGIEAVQQNASELSPRYKGDIHFAGGLRYAALLTRNVSGGNGNFNAIYGAQYAPDASLFFEWQPFHSEWFGNFGLMGGVGVAVFRGLGTYGVVLANTIDGGSFGSTSRSKFIFHAIPLNLGVNYRFNLLRLLRPFAAVSGVAVGYVETRNDGLAPKTAYSLGAQISAGVSLLLDWFEPSASWRAYESNGIRHTYLTAEYGFLIPFMGDVSYAVSGLQAGLTFEF